RTTRAAAPSSALRVASDPHGRGPKHATLQAVAVAKDVEDDRLAVTVFLRDGFVLVRIERLAHRVDSLEPGLLQHAEQLRVHELHALANLLVRVTDVGERELQVVDDGQQLLDDTRARALDHRGLLPQRALAVVLEVRLHTLRELTQIVTLTRQRVEISLDRGGGVLLGLVDRDVLDRVVRAHYALRSSPSSTISASATSSSDGADAPASPPGAPAPPAAACCCCACAYSRCANSWLAWTRASCFALMASVSSPLRA